VTTRGRDPDRPRDRDPDGPRDRDPSGRPRNSRARDELGRPLPRTASSDVPRIPDDLVVTPGEAATLGGELLLAGRPFHAHEVFEAAWKSGAHQERDLWQGLAQIAVGITHARRGNATGAITLLRRGAQRVDRYATSVAAQGGDFQGGPRYGIDAAFVAERAAGIATRIERDGAASIREADLLLPLSPPG
jgi:hypothetical protein